MNEQRWKKQLQKEADEILFEELEFDDRLKAGVRARIEAEKTSEPIPDSESVGKFREDGHSRFLKRNKNRRRITGLVVAASLAAVITFSLSGVLTNPEQVGRLAEGHLEGDGIVESIEGGNGTITLMTEDPLLPGDDNEVNELFVAAGDDGGLKPTSNPELGGDTDGSSSQLHVELADLDEASELYGEPLALPDYIPDGYEAVRISASAGHLDQEQLHGANEIGAGAADEIVIEYKSIDLVDREGSGFALHIRKQNFDMPLEQPIHGQFIELSGGEAILTIAGANVELHWMLGKSQFRLAGDLDSNTMIRIAESVQE